MPNNERNMASERARTRPSSITPENVYVEVRAALAELVAMSQDPEIFSSISDSVPAAEDVTYLLQRLRDNLQEISARERDRRAWQNKVSANMNSQNASNRTLKSEVEELKIKARETSMEYSKAIKAKEEAEARVTSLQYRLDETSGTVGRVAELEKLLNEKDKTLCKCQSLLDQKEDLVLRFAEDAFSTSALDRRLEAVAIQDERDAEYWKAEYELLREQSMAKEDSLKRDIKSMQQRTGQLRALLCRQAELAEEKLSAMDAQCALVKSSNEHISCWLLEARTNSDK